MGWAAIERGAGWLSVCVARPVIDAYISHFINSQSQQSQIKHSARTGDALRVCVCSMFVEETRAQRRSKTGTQFNKNHL